MSVSAGPSVSDGPFPGNVFPRLVRLVLGLLLAGSAILLAG